MSVGTQTIAPAASALSLLGLEGRVILVTGASGLIGSAAVRLLASLGASVVGVDLREPLESEGVRAISADVTRENELRDLLAETGTPDGLVNGAGIDPKFDAETAAEHTARPEDLPIELWNESLAVNVTGTFLATRVIGAAMAEAGRGAIVNFGSTYALVAPDQRLYDPGDGTPPGIKPPDYPVTKAAVIQMTRYFAVYWAKSGVRVNSITPGGVRNAQDEGFLERYAARTPMGRMASPDEIAGPLAFLLSDAASYMTGANLVVDGGWTAW